MTSQETLLLWAKKNDTEREHYPLLYHMLDVATVTQVMWDRVLQASTKHFLAGQLGLPEDETGRWLAFWAGLHDIGKATPAFQAKSDEAKQNLLKAGFNFRGYDTDIHHSVATVSILKSLLEGRLPKTLSQRVATAVGGHHGIFPRSQDLKRPGQLGDNLWRQKWSELLAIIDELVGADKLTVPRGHPGPEHAFFMILAGLTSVADWIASNESYFCYQPSVPLPGHSDYAKQRADKAIYDLRWEWRPPEMPGQFGEFFRFAEIRPLQGEIVSVSGQLAGSPGLVIIEAPMGEGKTEAAIYLADSWLATLKHKGCYFALPTQATSNQMFGRVRSFLEKRYADQKVNLILLHGHAALSAEFAVLKENRGNLFELHDVDLDGQRSYDRSQASVVASEWFTYRKRGLLSPFGVGTIDQTLLAVLQTKHVFVRLFGLAGKTIIIDEVHAYDAYMTTLLERLLEWLAAMGSSVILLSATLPRERKDALLKAYVRGTGGGDKDIPTEVVETKYPRISWAVGGEFKAKSIDTSPQCTKELHIEWTGNNLLENSSCFEFGMKLQEALSGGGCAAVICNTVDHAQQVCLALKEYFHEIADDGYPELDLFHARYLFGDRDRREKRALFRFGKNGGRIDCGEEGVKKVRRPSRAVLVATQVIEQSLDLDFDIMATEMAPVDLILQRAGRLQRHPQKRPPGFEGKPTTLWICSPELKEGGIPNFGGGTEAVYDRHILLRSWLVLKDRNTISIPNDIEGLIEEVYGERECPTVELKREWNGSLQELKKKMSEYESKAKANSILPPTYPDDILEDFNRDLEEDNPKLHESLQALTRISEGPTLSIVCLYGDESHPCLDVACQQTIDTTACLEMDAAIKLLHRTATVSHRGLVHQIIGKGGPVYDAWRKSPWLRHHYLLFFNEQNMCPLGDYEVHLDPELGLIIQKKNT